MQGPFRVHIGKEARHTELPGNGADREESAKVILLFSFS